MIKDISILVFEKDKFLKIVLYDQLNKEFKESVKLVDNIDAFFELIQSNSFSIYILNLDLVYSHKVSLLKTLKLRENNSKLILIHNKDFSITDLRCNDNIFHMKKPFKVEKLIKYIYDPLDVYVHNLMPHIIFYPRLKTIKNSLTDVEVHLTETESKLLNYFVNNLKFSINKNELLSKVWGYNKNTDTHTLETHVYRLKQKLHNLEPNLSFSVINENGKYYIKKD